MARKRAGFFAAAFLLVLLTTAPSAQAAVYDTRFWTLTGAFSYDVINPSTLNDISPNDPLQGLVGERLIIERGLAAPNWTHWVEFGLLSGTAEGQDTSLVKFQQKLSYLSIIPLGVTNWFSRTAYIDFGLSFGAGLALSPKYTSTTTSAAGVASIVTATGGASPVFTGAIDGRFWLGKYVGVTMAGGFRYCNPTLASTGVTGTKTNLVSLSMVVGATIAIGGVKGTGRTFVEVIPSEGTKNQAKPQMKPVIRKVAPTGSNGGSGTAGGAKGAAPGGDEDTIKLVPPPGQ